MRLSNDQQINDISPLKYVLFRGAAPHALEDRNFFRQSQSLIIRNEKNKIHLQEIEVKLNSRINSDTLIVVNAHGYQDEVTKSHVIFFTQNTGIFFLHS